MVPDLAPRHCRPPVFATILAEVQVRSPPLKPPSGGFFYAHKSFQSRYLRVLRYFWKSLVSDLASDLVSDCVGFAKMRLSQGTTGSHQCELTEHESASRT
jgi:hypothetical protein